MASLQNTKLPLLVWKEVALAVVMLPLALAKMPEPLVVVVKFELSVILPP